MIATRTLSLVAIDSSEQLLADVQDALQNGDQRGCGQQIDEPLECAPWREHEAGREDDDALGPRAEADVAAEAERLCFRADVGNEERAGDRDDREDDRRVVAGTREDEAD